MVPSEDTLTLFGMAQLTVLLHSKSFEAQDDIYVVA